MPDDESVAIRGDEDLVALLRKRDEAAFAEIVRAWSPTMLRVARAHVSTDESAAEVVQEAWLAVVKGLAAFEGRSSLKTWAFRIVVNLAKTRGVKEKRSSPFSSLLPEDEGPTVDPARFRSAADPNPRAWAAGAAPEPWSAGPEGALLRGESRALLARAVDRLPERHRVVLTLRDVEGLTSEEVCELLDVSPENQRVLLHRARAKVRSAMEDYYRGKDSP
jgi:RNA polymerase sigma-70 factor (ECF subfamily)